jgi:biopolymer transport protein ExbB
MILLSTLLQVSESLNKLSVGDTAGHHLSFFELLVKGGVILIPLGILSIIAIYLISEKFYVIGKGTKVNFKTIKELKVFIQNDEMENAMTLIEKERGAFSVIFLHALKNIYLPVKEIESEIESISNIEIAKLTVNLNYLGLIAGIAPMLGFIGTISGIIKIFYNISVTDNISIGVISGGLYEKMISSGSGLIVGVIAYSGYHILNMKLDRFISFIEAEAFEVINLIKEKRKNQVN